MNNIYYVIDRTDDELLIDMGYTNKENEELKQRIDKAIEYIENYTREEEIEEGIIIRMGNTNCNLHYLLSILKGENNKY